jgi:type II secretory pathway pseudopilin PulG
LFRKNLSKPRSTAFAPRNAVQSDEAGFTLLEALLALAVTAVCLAAIGALMATKTAPRARSISG